MDPRETESGVTAEITVHFSGKEMPIPAQKARLDVEAATQSAHANDRGRRSFAVPVRAERFLDGYTAGVWTEQRVNIASSQHERFHVGVT